MKSLMRVEKGGYLKHIKVSAWEQHHQRERVESSATAVISEHTEHPLLRLSAAWTATVKQVEQNDALQRFSQPLVHTLKHTHRTFQCQHSHYANTHTCTLNTCTATLNVWHVYVSAYGLIHTIQH